MELEELKNEWQRLDDRMDRMEQRMGRLTAGGVAGSFRPAFDRLLRRFRLSIVVALLVPMNFWGAFCRYGAVVEMMPLLAAICLFAVAVIVQNLLLQDRLRRIDPAGQTLREACAAVIRLRRLYLRGVACCVPFAALWILWLGGVLWHRGDAYVLYGVATGAIVGLPLGTVVFLRNCRAIDALQQALEEAEA
ncbi:MAG: hypothetical protein K2K30_02535 [Alistipes sp.]|nr:hypothetical protein [Alistipes sp.]